MIKEKINISEEDLQILNSKYGLRSLFGSRKVNTQKALNTTKYIHELMMLQIELIKLQDWVLEHKKKVVVLFEGRDAAGKGGAIRRITEHINPRFFRVVALDKPTIDERQQWFFQRYVNQLPNPGEMVFFDRSWYNRAVVEPVNGFCTNDEYETFMNHVNDFEDMVISSDLYLVKLYFSISKKEQASRFKDIENSPHKQWKITPVDKNAQKLWDEYTKYKEKMFEVSNTSIAPWHIINADNKSQARLDAIKILLNSVPYNKKIAKKTK
ncbi:MAG: polyphosphate kinase 2 [Chitinophagales bacterium]